MSIPERKRGEISTLFANMGKAIAAYVRLIVPGPSRFDLYAESVQNGDAATAARVFTRDEAEGLRLFIGAAGCTNCHNGPLFTNGDFHNVDTPPVPGKKPDRGRADGITQVLADEFNCLGPHSDAGPGDCAELKYMDREGEKYVGFFKTPSLRNVAERPPFMHAGQFRSLRELLRFYRDESRGGDIIHRDLTEGQLDQVEAFLRTLSGPVTVDWSAAQ
jgi:cytochrome c peroxidase